MQGSFCLPLSARAAVFCKRWQRELNVGVGLSGPGWRLEGMQVAGWPWVRSGSCAPVLLRPAGPSGTALQTSTQEMLPSWFITQTLKNMSKYQGGILRKNVDPVDSAV
jgi:hypothetical protein